MLRPQESKQLSRNVSSGLATRLIEPVASQLGLRPGPLTPLPGPFLPQEASSCCTWSKGLGFLGDWGMEPLGSRAHLLGLDSSYENSCLEGLTEHCPPGTSDP